ncbi:MAG: glycoside hydrolase family 9 protein [Bacteroidota bacterium]
MTLQTAYAKILLNLKSIGVLSFLVMGCKSKEVDQFGAYSEQIRINQIGYYPKAVKKAVLADVNGGDTFYLIDTLSKTKVFSGVLSEEQTWGLSNEKVRIADFTNFKETGVYSIRIPDVGISYPFAIRNNVLDTVFKGSIKGLYYQRSGMALEKEYAGKWHRATGHPDDSVAFHPSSGKSGGFKASPKGWYDAGDYNKYVINANFPLGQWYRLYEEYPEAIADGALNIPESGNGISDYLDELKYEMDWALTMQDDDGGLFHKLTTRNFEGMVMPSEAKAPRFIVGKSTAATLDFAACAAQAYRVFFPVDPVYAQTCLAAAKRAYRWAQKNPKKIFVNPVDIHTGEYGDTDVQDEWFWANAELYVTTKDRSYLNQLEIDTFNFEFQPGESWTEFMRFLGVFSLLAKGDFSGEEEMYQKLKQGLLNSANQLAEKAGQFEYFQPIDDFHWGSNSDVLNAAMLMAQAYRLTRDIKYLKGVQQAMDYILGNNAKGVSYVTGFGDKTPMFIHHRQSAADGIPKPVPGLLVGGPNSRLQDGSKGVVYPENVPPMKAWVDQERSYASNEVCLNWNAPLTYILGFLEQESDGNGTDVK